MKEKFQEHKFNKTSVEIIAAANEIIREYSRQGFSLTLRQLYYQFVARAMIENTQRAYKRLGAIISNARLAGLVDWSAIEDRTRELERQNHWDSPADIIESAANGYALDKWEDQDCRIEVWIEKEALTGVIEPICEELDINYFACRGYVSQSEQYAAGKRHARYIDGGQDVLILHLGDHDPSGMDMTRDNQTRLDLFSWHAGVDVRRIALNMDQVEQYSPPPNPAKMTDSRSGEYCSQYGDDSWELDALEPKVIKELIRDEVYKRRDVDLLHEVEEREEKDMELLALVRENWTQVAEFVESL